jgi:Condensin II complex subunit CAP-H2 or CNDH2, C-term
MLNEHHMLSNAFQVAFRHQGANGPSFASLQQQQALQMSAALMSKTPLHSLMSSRFERRGGNVASMAAERANASSSTDFMVSSMTVGKSGALLFDPQSESSNGGVFGWASAGLLNLGVDIKPVDIKVASRASKATTEVVSGPSKTAPVIIPTSPRVVTATVISDAAKVAHAAQVTAAASSLLDEEGSGPSVDSMMETEFSDQFGNDEAPAYEEDKEDHVGPIEEEPAAEVDSKAQQSKRSKKQSSKAEVDEQESKASSKLSSRAKTAPAFDNWLQLDPDAQGPASFRKPYRKGRTYAILKDPKLISKVGPYAAALQEMQLVANKATEANKSKADIDILLANAQMLSENLGLPPASSSSSSDSTGLTGPSPLHQVAPLLSLPSFFVANPAVNGGIPPNLLQPHVTTLPFLSHLVKSQKSIQTAVRQQRKQAVARSSASLVAAGAEYDLSGGAGEEEVEEPVPVSVNDELQGYSDDPFYTGADLGDTAPGDVGANASSGNASATATVLSSPMQVQMNAGGLNGDRPANSFSSPLFSPRRLADPLAWLDARPGETPMSQRKRQAEQHGFGSLVESPSLKSHSLNELGSSATNGGDDYSHLVARFLSQVEQAASRAMESNEMAARVESWQTKLETVLGDEENRREFDIQAYCKEILNKLLVVTEVGKDKSSDVDMDQGKNKLNPVNFHAVMPDSLFRYDVCRVFLASLQLANLGNVKIIPPGVDANSSIVNEDVPADFGSNLKRGKKSSTAVENDFDPLSTFHPCPPGMAAIVGNNDGHFDSAFSMVLLKSTLKTFQDSDEGNQIVVASVAEQKDAGAPVGSGYTGIAVESVEAVEIEKPKKGGKGKKSKN